MEGIKHNLVVLWFLSRVLIICFERSLDDESVV